MLLSALKLAPVVLSAGREIVGALTGREPPPSATSEDVWSSIEGLPSEQRTAAVAHVMAAKRRFQELDTERFHALTSGDAERIRSTARPQIALRAMGVVTLFARGVAAMFALLALDWAVRAGFVLFGVPAPKLPSVTSLLAQLEPVATFVWVPLLGSFWACVEVVKKYMGCRERDKARCDEMKAGKPLESAQATIVDAGGAVAGIIRALKGR